MSKKLCITDENVKIHILTKKNRKKNTKIQHFTTTTGLTSSNSIVKTGGSDSISTGVLCGGPSPQSEADGLIFKAKGSPSKSKFLEHDRAIGDKFEGPSSLISLPFSSFSSSVYKTASRTSELSINASVPHVDEFSSLEQDARVWPSRVLEEPREFGGAISGELFSIAIWITKLGFGRHVKGNVNLRVEGKSVLKRGK